jgi:hypothetical protein
MREILSIDVGRFNNGRFIEGRIAAVPTSDRSALQTALPYLYNDEGPVNLPRARLLIAQRHLEAAELIVARWLYTRTNGNLRSSYGTSALFAARLSRYRCRDCGFADVRVLNLDHVGGRIAGTPFACLCANCHTIKSRAQDWTGGRLAGPKAVAADFEAAAPFLVADKSHGPRV